jgi:hypothetical protein
MAGVRRFRSAFKSESMESRLKRVPLCGQHRKLPDAFNGIMWRLRSLIGGRQNVGVRMCGRRKLAPYYLSPCAAIAFSLLLSGPISGAEGPCGPVYLGQSLNCGADFTEYEANELGFRVLLALPRAHEGETVSSRIYVELDRRADDKDDSREELAWLNTQRLRWGQNSTPIGDGVVVWTVPAGLKEVPDNLAAHLIDPGFRIPVNQEWPPGIDLSGWRLYQMMNRGFTIPLESVNESDAARIVEVAMNDGEHFISPLDPTLGRIEIRGPFNGDLRKTTVKLAFRQAEIVSESPQTLLFAPPKGSTGLQRVEVTEAGHSITGNVRLPTVKSSSERRSDLR